MQTASVFTKRPAFFKPVPNPAAISLVPAYDPSCNFARVISANKNKPDQNKIMTVHLGKIHQAVNRSDFEAISKITIPATRSSNGMGLWDVIFNDTDTFQRTGTVQFAGPDFKPIPNDRISYRSSFLNFEMQVSRVKHNRLEVGDHAAVAYTRLVGGETVVLVYRVDSLCFVKNGSRLNTDPDVEQSVHAFNLGLIHYYTIRADGSAEFNFVAQDKSSDDDDVITAVGSEFVQNVYGASGNPLHGYVWAASFIPKQARPGLSPQSQAAVELIASGNVHDVGFETLRQMMREKYIAIGNELRIARRALPKGERLRTIPSAPTIRVISPVDDPERQYVMIDGGDVEHESLLVLRKTGNQDEWYQEPSIFGRDLRGRILTECGDITMAPATPGQPSYFFRDFEFIV